ncbi:MAG: energy-dependent translational throttle protein EttA [Saprospiraceae bacterium]|jgi:sulfate-transporting ATPase|uniref:energy-dependent translational throttle protein EttA n=1 Tax=Candidatus Brachybacter algidus TaxID=2982024 RepID=UPI001B7CD039|nr:energy-dependent translational throttle protein EttA [Candidatus Brachybacter algidus]MBP7306812.1 energy-dependent translational throttle protein EttA [Saprospiraceae bacterium]MBK6448179.1 energy-dependent translational throttle protein EttA [Candidatus Brachybacter algidus]MBK7602992.1 energy-dependent translational throttle protein EttA [Candidatus Brachybacter algidus]MBK9024478.1 energy-dependent translational throttle protein EttA [Candidatus Brachybacter algidus]MBK9396524.1 energy-
MADNKIIFTMTGVSKIIPPNKAILNNIYLSFYYGAKIGVLGLNGAGKSTLLKLIAGIDPNYNGHITFDKDYKIGYLEQEPTLDPEKTVLDIVKEGVKEVVDILAEYEAVNAKFAEEITDDEMNALIEKQGELTEKLEQKDAWNLEYKLEMAMEALRLPAPDAKVSVLSGGERRRVALCRLLLSEPDILLLDEPTNHLDAESVDWLEQYLRNFPGTVIAVTHDRYFLDNVAGWILELDRGEGIPWEGNYSSWLQQKSNRLAQEEKTESKRRKILQRELEWTRMAPKARQAKSKARLTAYEKLAEESGNEKEAKLELFIPPGPRLGDLVIDFEHVAKSYGDRTLYNDLTFKIPKNAVVGIIGPNGVGKSTMFRMITGQEQPDSGKVIIGDSVKIAYVDQSHEDLKPEKSVYEVLSGGLDNLLVNGLSVNARAYISKFNFNGTDQSKKVGVLSGGERNRLHLAMALKDGGNVILLDEPTNDIDINTLRALEEAIENFAGCVLVISHDRWFIDRLATHILAFEDEGAYFFEGNYSDYEENKKSRLGEQKKKSKFKNLLSI